MRIIRACREMGIETVAVYSEADREALHTQLADEAICIGPAPSSESYLNMEQIISATIVSGADAIHPGFGFLSENDRFAALCEQCHIIFIDQPQMSSANSVINQCQNMMIAAGVPVIPGSKNLVSCRKGVAQPQKKWGIRSLSRRPLVAAAKACVWLIIRMNWKMLCTAQVWNLPKQLLAIILCIWSTLWSIRNISSSRFWRIVSSRSCDPSKMIAPSREITRS